MTDEQFREVCERVVAGATITAATRAVTGRCGRGLTAFTRRARASGLPIAQSALDTLEKRREESIRQYKRGRRDIRILNRVLTAWLKAPGDDDITAICSREGRSLDELVSLELDLRDRVRRSCTALRGAYAEQVHAPMIALAYRGRDFSPMMKAPFVYHRYDFMRVFSPIWEKGLVASAWRDRVRKLLMVSNEAEVPLCDVEGVPMTPDQVMPDGVLTPPVSPSDTMRRMLSKIPDGLDRIAWRHASYVILAELPRVLSLDGETLFRARMACLLGYVEAYRDYFENDTPPLSIVLGPVVAYLQKKFTHPTRELRYDA